MLLFVRNCHRRISRINTRHKLRALHKPTRKPRSGFLHNNRLFKSRPLVLSAHYIFVIYCRDGTPITSMRTLRAQYAGRNCKLSRCDNGNQGAL
jgi:hypothetical protein